MKRKYMSPFVFEVFDSRNTSTKREIPLAGHSIVSAQEIAKRLSLQCHHVTVSNAIGFESFENGEMTDWSYPNGMGQIKINS